MEVSFAPQGTFDNVKEHFGCHSLGVWGVVALGVWGMEDRDVAKYPAVHRTALYNEELPGPKCQLCQG